MKSNYVIVFLLFPLIGCVSQRDFVEPSAANQGKPIRHGFWFGSENPKIEPPAFVPDKKAAERGAKLYASHCLQCHGPQGKGDGQKAGQTKTKPANLKLFAGMFPRGSFFIQIAHGKDDMPAWKDTLTRDEINDLTQYLHTLAQK